MISGQEPMRDDTHEPVGLDRGIERLESRRDSKEARRMAGTLKGQKVRGWTEKLLTRTLTGVVYVLLIIGCFFWGVIPTAALMSAMAWLCCSEFFRICRMAGRMPNEICGLTFALAFPWVGVLFNMRYLFIGICSLLMWAAIWYVFNPRVNISDVAVTVFGPFYTSCTLACLAMVRASYTGMDGALLALLVIGAMWAEDSFAYLIGSSLGRHKMAPRISPKKSWEGFYGGLVGSIAVWCVGAAFHICGITWPLAIAIGVIEGLLAVMGDLFESRIKRGVGVKDSGNILPGHGGLLDRTDSVLFGSVVAYFLLLLGGIL
ncbi:MAG: phosphatidate cytidylyltransferase [Coriobacteriales bacterium]|nr:phosphatidate cytidylyltransferase [Coriobacteriales bacterium]